MRIGTTHSLEQHDAWIMRQALEMVALRLEAGEPVTPEVLRNAAIVAYEDRPQEDRSLGIIFPDEVQDLIGGELDASFFEDD